MTETECVYCVVRVEYVNGFQDKFSLQSVNDAVPHDSRRIFHLLVGVKSWKTKKSKQAGRRDGKTGDWCLVMCANRRQRRRRISTQGSHRGITVSTNSFLVITLDRSNSCDLY